MKNNTTPPVKGKSFFDLSMNDKKSILHKAAQESNRAQKAFMESIKGADKIAKNYHITAVGKKVSPRSEQQDKRHCKNPSLVMPLLRNGVYCNLCKKKVPISPHPEAWEMSFDKRLEIVEAGIIKRIRTMVQMRKEKLRRLSVPYSPKEKKQYETE